MKDRLNCLNCSTVFVAFSTIPYCVVMDIEKAFLMVVFKVVKMFHVFFGLIVYNNPEINVVYRHMPGRRVKLSFILTARSQK